MKLGTLFLTSFLCLSLLTACGSSEDQDTPDANLEDSTSSIPPADTTADQETAEDLGTSGSVITLDTTQFSVYTKGGGHQLQILNAVDPEDVAYASSDEGVATVSDQGLVTAVDTGTATITVTFTDQDTAHTLSAIVTCRLEEEDPEEATPEAQEEPEEETPETPETPATPTPEPEPEPAPAPEPEPEPEPAPAPATVSLSNFYSSVAASHGMQSGMEKIAGEFLSNFYPGLSSITLSQSEMYISMITASSVEIALVEVANASDVNTVKGIFQNRIKTQADGGAWYPEALEAWANQSSVVVNGNFVMMVVHPQYQTIVNSFNALF